MKITIEVVKWDDYNPRKDIKSMSWFKLSSDIAFSPTLFGLTAQAKWFWVFTLSAIAKNINTHLTKTGCLPDTPGRLETTTEYLAHHSGVNEDLIVSFYEEFKERGLVLINPPLSTCQKSVRDTNEPVRDTNASVPKRESNSREDKKEKREESALSFFYNHSVFKDTPKEALDAWIKRFDEEYVLQEFNGALAWKGKTQLKKSFQVFFDDWLVRGWAIHLERKSKAKKIKPEVEANAKRFASEFYDNVRSGTDENPWLGNTNFDFEIMEKIGDLAKIRNSKPSDKQKIMSEIKAVILQTMDTG